MEENIAAVSAVYVYIFPSLPHVEEVIMQPQLMHGV
jgi:hypothetical protein